MSPSQRGTAWRKAPGGGSNFDVTFYCGKTRVFSITSLLHFPHFAA